jgi:Arc/MetJ-type ribon-helix-helix transcriptional regulator
MNEPKRKITCKKFEEHKLVYLTSEIKDKLRRYCREKEIESESELIRQAIVKYIEPDDYNDAGLKLTGIKDIRESLGRLADMTGVLFSYLHTMHTNLLAYHPEIDAELKDAALRSAQARQEKFYQAFRESLREDPPFFEKLLHDYVSGDLDGAP